jgi:hypothetical protein
MRMDVEYNCLIPCTGAMIMSSNADDQCVYENVPGVKFLMMLTLVENQTKNLIIPSSRFPVVNADLAELVSCW